MRLERLEISGFKSFSDRSELAFDKGVTAIVGPNGCGKSNVADAITWVLGEQSAKSLRGDKMEDVIFSGSDARKAGATAEVRLRLSGLPVPFRASAPVEDTAAPELKEFNAGNGNGNGHHSSLDDIVEEFTRDIEVTRRLYRSGESEYLIDGEVSRLRDVHELLMDTGLGAKAYAIIEQGKIGMILSSRPADRRQLIEEAAGITKYKSRRRTAELKLDAAQQNLTRIDDIVFEVEKQRGALKRQAAKARRYRRLREELRRWEKVLFARRYRELAASIEQARARLIEARAREAAAAAHLAEGEATLSRLRLEQAESDARAVTLREGAHAQELDINRRQQQLEFSRHELEALGLRAEEISAEIHELEVRREPTRVAIEARRAAVVEAERARDEAAAVVAGAAAAHADAQSTLDRLEGEVESARTESYRVANTITAIRHGIDHAEAQRTKVAGTLGKLDLERDEVLREQQVAQAEHSAVSDALNQTRQAMDAAVVAKGTREAALAMARTEYDGRLRAVRAREQDLFVLEARLASLEEIEASRAGFGDAARMVLVQANGHVGQQGAVADYLEVDRPYERAVEACLGELLEHVIVERHDQAAAGLALVREHDAGRCGFVVVDPGSNGYHPHALLEMPGIVPVREVLRINGPHVATIQKVLPEAYIATTFDQAVAMSRQTSAPVATLDGDVFRGPHLVAGGAKVEAKGILQAKLEIKELRERVASDRMTLTTLSADIQALEIAIAEAAEALASTQAEQHRHEKAIVGFEANAARAADDTARLTRKADVIAFERRSASEEWNALELRLTEARASIERLQNEQQECDGRLSRTQQSLSDARDAIEEISRRAADAGAEHARLLERASAMAAEVARLEEGARELEERIQAKGIDRQETETRRAGFRRSIAEGEVALDGEIRTLDDLRERLRHADDMAGALREQVEAQEGAIRESRRAVEQIRATVNELDLARATAESDLSHLAQSCVDAVQSSLDEVLSEVEQLERTGDTTPNAAVIAADEAESDDEDGAMREGGDADAQTAMSGSMTAEEAIVQLKAKVDKLGPVNMMAIEQFDELETRHVFLTTQRKDLVDSIAQTTEAIKRIDDTTKTRFREAFTAIQANFQVTFATLFGGGHAGLNLLDENDPLETGIDIVASPPGKRLQSVQLLSGGEKALTAIALMFAIFRYKPSPFCLLDEIDAPLDDANVTRFVEMLRSMLEHTQFILITHNRRTMEIANRLYGVTMEEPGVSKLISVQLN